MNLVMRYIECFELWIIYERGPMDIYWTVGTGVTRDAAIECLERYARGSTANV